MRYIASLVFASALAFAGTTSATITHDFSALDTLNTPELVLEGVAITGTDSAGQPANVFVLRTQRLGVVGGNSSALVDREETVTFSFQGGLATQISYHVTSAGRDFDGPPIGASSITAYDRFGKSLGTVYTESLGTKSVSEWFGHTEIASFSVQAYAQVSLGIGLLTFDLIPGAFWAGLHDNAWDNADNWVGAVPQGVSQPTDVYLDPLVGRTILGPSGLTQVENLLIDAREAGITTLQLQRQGVLTMTGQATIAAYGRLSGDGTLHAEQGIINEGEIHLNDGDLAGPSIVNTGVIRGDGRIDAMLINEVNGRIRVDNGKRLRFIGRSQGEAHINHGEIILLGGELSLDHRLINLGSIAGHGVIDPLHAIDNGEGAVITFDADSSVIGQIANRGTIALNDASTVTFFHEVDHNGQMLIEANAQAIFLGRFTGSGVVAGTGEAVFASTIQPGNSPGVLGFEGDVTLTDAGELVMELAGVQPGTQYDQLHVDGTLTLAGTLKVVLLDGYIPAVGDSFDLLDWGALVGAFDTIELPELMDGLSWSTADLYVTGTISVIPEPATGLLLGGAALLLMQRRRVA